jgi:hypothetical protein
MYAKDRLENAENTVGERSRRQILLEMADFIETIPPKKFNISLWWDSFTNCGCAVGHMIKAKRFGLGNINISAGGVLEQISPATGLSTKDATELFTMAQYGDMAYGTTPKEVAARAREMAYA